MKIKPKSEQEFASRRLMDPGTYSFEILDAVEKNSKSSGEPMIEVILKFQDMHGRYHTIFDYLMDKEPMDYKIRQLFESLGMLDKYESGEIFASDLRDKKGKAKITVKKDKNGQYPDRNQVQEYLLFKQEELVTFFDDDNINF